MKIGIPREIHIGERRVAATPETVEQLVKLGYTVAVEAAPARPRRSPTTRTARRAPTSRRTARALWAIADIVLKVRAPEPDLRMGVHEAALLREGATLISFIWPAQNPDLMNRLMRAQSDRAGDGLRAAHDARAEARRAEFDGEYRRLSRRHRSGAALRPLLHGPDHRRGQGAAGEGDGDRRRRRRARRHRRRAQPRCDRQGVRRAARSAQDQIREPRRRGARSSTSTKTAPVSAATRSR